MSEGPKRPTLNQLYIQDPQLYAAEARRLQQSMLNWWQDQFIAPHNLMEAPLANDELLVLEELFVALTLPSAAVCYAGAHGLDLQDPRTQAIGLRLALFYGLLVGKGYLRPGQPPTLPEDFLAMMNIWQQEQQLALAQAGQQIKKQDKVARH